MDAKFWLHVSEAAAECGDYRAVTAIMGICCRIDALAKAEGIARASSSDIFCCGLLATLETLKGGCCESIKSSGVGSLDGAGNGLGLPNEK